MHKSRYNATWSEIKNKLWWMCETKFKLEKVTSKTLVKLSGWNVISKPQLEYSDPSTWTAVWWTCCMDHTDEACAVAHTRTTHYMSFPYQPYTKHLLVYGKFSLVNFATLIIQQICSLTVKMESDKFTYFVKLSNFSFSEWLQLSRRRSFINTDTQTITHQILTVWHFQYLSSLYLYWSAVVWHFQYHYISTDVPLCDTFSILVHYISTDVPLCDTFSILDHYISTDVPLCDTFSILVHYISTDVPLCDTFSILDHYISTDVQLTNYSLYQKYMYLLLINGW